MTVTGYSRKWLLIVCFTCGFVLLETAWLVQAAPPEPPGGEGRAIFEQKCAGCHTIGGGDMAGPDLRDVTDRRDPAWLRRWLAEPDKVLAEGDPIAVDLLNRFNGVPMPNQNLSPAEIDALLDYLGSATDKPENLVEDQREVLTGNPDAGRVLFTGARPLTNGGEACIACHDTAALGAPGGGLLGPDLTRVVERYGGETGLRSVLGTITFPSMVPVFRNRPLSPQEQADLTAFLQGSAGKNAPSRGQRHFALYILAFGAMDLFLGVLFVWNRRLPQRTRRSLARR